jgi:hypothetical protein
MLLNRISEKLVLPPKDISRDSEREEYPRAKLYTVPNRYEVFRYPADSLQVDGVPYMLEVYFHQQKEIQAVIVAVLPVGVDTQSKVHERIQMMLETLKVSDKRPPVKRKPPPPSTATPGTPAPAEPLPAVGF